MYSSDILMLKKEKNRQWNIQIFDLEDCEWSHSVLKGRSVEHLCKNSLGII